MISFNSTSKFHTLTCTCAHTLYTHTHTVLYSHFQISSDKITHENSLFWGSHISVYKNLHFTCTCLCVYNVLHYSILYTHFFLSVLYVHSHTIAHMHAGVSLLLYASMCLECARSHTCTCLFVRERRWVYPSFPVHFLEIMTAISSSQ